MASFKIKKLILKDKKTGTQVVGEIESGGKPITAVDSLPSATKEEFEKGKIYTQGEILQYISKVALSEPTLSQVASLIAATNGMAAAAVGTDIYLFGGYSSSTLNTIYKFSTTTGQLIALSTTLPTALYKSVAAVIGTDIYLLGGQSDGSITTAKNTIYKFSTISETLETLSAILPTKLTETAAAVVGTDIYIFGGRTERAGLPPVNTIYKFSTTSGVVETLSTTLGEYAYNIGAAAVGTDIYLFGGQVSSGVSNKIYKFSTTTGILTTLPITLPTALNEAPAVVVGTDIYLFGGWTSASSSAVTNTIYKFSITTKCLYITMLSIKLINC